MKPKQTFKEYYTALSASEKVKLAKKADTSVPYLFQIASGHRMVGFRTAVKLKAADKKITDKMLRPDLYQAA